MSELPILVLAGLAGGGLGAIFFGGLWWTVRHGMAAGQPARWLLLGGILRMGIALGGFYYVGGGEWPRLVACLVGFIVARFGVIRLTQNREARHAS